MTPPRWAVVEFDADRVLIARWPHVDEAEARDMFTYVTKGRSQRSDVVQRARSAALLQDGQVVEACSIRPTRRAPWVGEQCLRDLDPDPRARLHELDLLAARLALTALRVDGEPRVGLPWSFVRAVACGLWDTVRGHEAGGVDEGGWWLVQWSCGCHQAHRGRRALHKTCPYHDTAAAVGPLLVDR